MPKIAFLALSTLGGLAVLPLLFAPIAPILAQETGSGTEAVKDTFDLPTSPLDGLIKEWFSGLNIKEKAQSGMTKAQSELEDAARQGIGSAQDAAKAEIAKQTSQAIQGARQKAEAYVGEVVATVKTGINNLITNIKSFFTDLFKKPSPTT